MTEIMMSIVCATAIIQPAIVGRALTFSFMRKNASTTIKRLVIELIPQCEMVPDSWIKKSDNDHWPAKASSNCFLHRSDGDGFQHLSFALVPTRNYN
jgi:hypothetical protein